MRLEFEKWIDNQKIPSLASEVFKEAVICYKVNAYRAAMLLSFTGLQVILKSRINSADKPNDVVPKKWDEYKTKILDDDEWDKVIANSIIPADQITNKVFNISSDLIEQYTYWKNRRNDAAHSKDNRITNSYIEMFWQFLESNLPKFVIKGSHQEIINKITTYFDLNISPLSSDFSNLIAEIPNAVDLKQKIQFLENIKEIIKSSKRPDKQKIKFWDKLLDIDILKEEGTSFLLREVNQGLYFKIAQSNSTRLAILHDQEAFLRKIYMEWLFAYQHEGDFKIFTYLINHNIIPPDEFKDVINNLLRRWNNLNFTFGKLFPIGYDLEIFSKTMASIWEEKIISGIDSLDWGNKYFNITLVESYLELIGVSKPIVEKICSVFYSLPYPYLMESALNSFFGESSHSEILNDFIQIADEHNFKLPPKWDLRTKAIKNEEPQEENESEEIEV